MGAGTLALQLYMVYTHYYSRPIQHLAVPRVIQYTTYTDIQTERRYSNLTNTKGGMNSVPL